MYRRNAQGTLPQVKELESSITPRNIYLIMDENPSASDQLSSSNNKTEPQVRPQPTATTSSETCLISPRFYRVNQMNSFFPL